MPQRSAQPESAWIQVLAPVSPSRKRLWVLSLILAGWICFLVAMFFLTGASRPCGADSARQAYGVVGGPSMIGSLCDEYICATFNRAI